MQLLKRFAARTAAAAVLALAAAACTDRPDPVRPDPDPGGPGGPGGGGPITVTYVDCTANVQTKTVNCGTPSAGDAHGDFIEYAGQNLYVRLQSTNVNYDSGTDKFTFDVTVRNLIPQPIGTVDGTTLDAYGVKVYFVTEPVATSGSGTIAIDNEDGSDVFSVGTRPYYQYNQVLDQYELSPAKQWQFDIPGTVNTFSFSVAIAAAVQFPEGWIEIQPSVHTMPALQTRSLSAKVFNALGVVDSSGTLTINWATGDANVATVSPVGWQASGAAYIATLTGVQAGTTTATADVASDSRTGGMTSNIGGIRRIWKGSVSTDYNNGANWRHGRVPNSQDSAVVNGDSATQFPVMAQNNTVGGVIMEPGALTPSIDIASFDYTLTSSIDHGATGQILATTGRMIFTGVAKTISGGLTNVDYRHARFTGTYSLNTNLNVTGGRIVVQGGRLRNTAFRIRVRPN